MSSEFGEYSPFPEKRVSSTPISENNDKEGLGLNDLSFP